MMTSEETLVLLKRIHERLRQGELATPEEFALLCHYPTDLPKILMRQMEHLRFNLNENARLGSAAQKRERRMPDETLRLEMIAKARLLMPTLISEFKRLIEQRSRRKPL